MNEHSSYEISKRLHDKGFRAEHNNVWVYHYDYKLGLIWSLFPIDDEDNVNEKVPAYTFTELWGAMPKEIGEAYLVVDGLDEATRMYYTPNVPMNCMDKCAQRHESPTECAAMMVEWLLDNGHIKID